MNSYMAVLTFIAAFIFLLPTPARATELESIYARVRLSPAQYEKWLASPMKHMTDFDDWNTMTPEWSEDWRRHYYKWKFETMGDMIRAAEKQAAEWTIDVGDMTSRPLVRYDAEKGVFTYAQLFYDENFINFMLDLSALRTLSAFKDTDGPDFLVIYPFFWDPGTTVILEIGRGTTKFHSAQTAPEAFKDFIREANAHFDAELEEMEPDED